MNGREALKALAEGQRVRLAAWPRSECLVWCDEAGGIVNQHGNAGYLYTGNDWLVVEQPATDAELIAEMERLEGASHDQLTGREAFRHCAQMLRERKVKP